jgi:sporulation protein YlmC with PRC-barrel domain
LYSLLLAMGSPTVNLLVLDVEGAETLILRTVPWDQVDIEVVNVITIGDHIILNPLTN